MKRRARMFLVGAVVMLLMAVTVAPAMAEGPADDGAPRGRIAFQSNRSGDHEIYTMNVDGSELTRLTFNPGNDAEPSWSPDGQWIAFFSRRYEQQGEIHKIRADGTEETRLTFNTRFDWYPSWSPDGQWIAFASDRDMGPSDGTWGLMIYKMRSDGTDVVQLTENPAADSRPSWSPDSQWIAFHSNRDGHWSNYNIYKMRPDGSEETRLTDHSAADSMPRWSPDSQWICFGTCRDGNYEVYKMRADGTEQTRLTNHPAEDAVCSWSPDGQYIVFHSKRSGNNELWIIRADGEGSPIQLTDNPADDLGPDWWEITTTPACEPATTRVSLASDGTQGNGNSWWWPFISEDGRYVAFYSYASNLVPEDTNASTDVFVHDRVTMQTTRVSVASDGTQANGNSYKSPISGNGRYLTFTSEASNLVPGDTNNADDIFVHDRQTGQTTRVSVASDGTQGNGNSSEGFISADGRYVVFRSEADNLVPGDTNGVGDIFVHDRQNGQTTRVSVASDGTQANAHSWYPIISADGQHVAFHTWASNLVPTDTNGLYDVFVHDRDTGQTTRVSIASDDTQGDGHSHYASLSADGRYVAFQSMATNLVPGDIGNSEDVFVHDRETGETTRVSVASDGTQGNGPSGYKFISADGRYVTFTSQASNLVPADSNGVWDIFLHDRQTQYTSRVSVASDGTQGDGDAHSPFISAGGQYVTFTSQASNLVSGDSNDRWDVFVRNICPAPPSDVRPPTTFMDLDGTMGSDGWFASAVVITLSATDEPGGSGVAYSEYSLDEGRDWISYTVPFTIAHEGVSPILARSVDEAANVEEPPVSEEVKTDFTGPSMVGSRSPDPNTNGWNDEDVKVHFDCHDGVSGISYCTPDTIVSSEGEGRFVIGTATDVAGNSASSTVTGINIDKTAPTAAASASPEPNAYGWNNTDVVVSFSGLDDLSGIDYCSEPTILSSDGVNQSTSGTCTDRAGNMSAASIASGINIDKTSPEIAVTRTPAANPNGWNNGEVTVQFDCEDPLSGVEFCPPDFALSAEGAGQSASGTVLDLAGNTACATVSNINIDLTDPTIIGHRFPGANSHGWNNEDITVWFECNDTLAGVAFCTSDTVLSNEGEDQSVTGSTRDLAGNAAATSVSDINIDKTAPTVTIAGLSPNPASVSESADLVADLTDERSGIQAGEWCAESESLACTWEAMTLTGEAGDLDRRASANISGLPAGVYSIKVKTRDLADNSSDVVQAFLVVYDKSAGFATGGGWIIPRTEPGDFLPGITGEDKANFGFVVKYKRGATIPGGQLEAHYRVGDFNLHSTEMHWMVINDNWAKFQGYATINLHSDELYYFRVDARDADQADRFVLKVWTADQNPYVDAPVYRASGDLMGGNISIHTK